MREKYLIIKCEELKDQYECDCNRIPITICENWEQWYQNNKKDVNYSFEVYEFKNNKFKCIKEYTNSIKKGMALYYWKEEQDPEIDFPNIIYQYENRTRNNKIPKEVQEYINKGHNKDDSLKNCGRYTFTIHNNYYVYGEYYDNSYSIGY